MNLIPDLIRLIACYCNNIVDISNLSLVCKSWFNFINNDSEKQKLLRLITVLKTDNLAKIYLTLALLKHYSLDNKHVYIFDYLNKYFYSNGTLYSEKYFNYHSKKIKIQVITLINNLASIQGFIKIVSVKNLMVTPFKFILDKCNNGCITINVLVDSLIYNSTLIELGLYQEIYQKFRLQLSN